ncbi:hypothetical protein CYMTET_45354, partial [Cymbomonas tetramitiformis]
MVKGGGKAAKGGDGDVLKSLKVSAPNGIKVYNIAAGKTIPAWLSDKAKRNFRKDEEYNRRVELIQDLEFPAVSQKVKFSKDGKFFMATGLHPPQVKVYELADLCMKFERTFTAEIVDFQVLSEDYSKMAFICMDRSVNFHAKFGAYHKIRTPRQGRDLAYCPETCDLFVVGSSPEMYRINLEQGRFMSPVVSKSQAINCCGISPIHGLMATGGEDGLLECWDPRSRESIGELDIAGGAAITAVRFDDETGMNLAAGNKEGIVQLFDIRSSKPMITKDHMNGVRIVDIKFHAVGMKDLGSRKVVSTDTRSAKIWDTATGNNFTVTPPHLSPLAKIWDTATGNNFT